MKLWPGSLRDVTANILFGLACLLSRRDRAARFSELWDE